MKTEYVLMNPTGNRTILVTSPVEKKDYHNVASMLMQKEPTAEQVGFLDVTKKGACHLNMAGGEFCGNATMSAAVFLCMKGLAESPVSLIVSGAKGTLKAEVKEIKERGKSVRYVGCVKMPSPVEFRDVKVKLGGRETILPAVIFEGITHILLNGIGIAKNMAEKYIREWSDELNAPCLGLIFYDEKKGKLKPLVYVKSPETLVWENSCGSGSVAEAAWLHHNGFVKDAYEFAEPGGKLTVRRKGRSFYLEGTVESEKEGTLTISGDKSRKKTTVKESETRVKESRATGKSVKKAGRAKENAKQLRKRTDAILARLDERYGTDYRCYLNYETPWQLLFSTIMSAQCTDERVNIVTKDLYVKYKSLEDFANADLKELEQDIHSTGFYHNKAKNIIACAKELLEKYGGEVPSDLESLTSLPGVGRKTANVIRGNIYHIDSIVVDTHVKRISKKLGLTEEEDPEKVEFDLMEKLPRDHWILYNIHIITLGRSICKAPTPKCEECFLKDICPSFGNSQNLHSPH